MKILQEYNLTELKEQMDLKGVKRFRAEQIYSFAQALETKMEKAIR